MKPTADLFLQPLNTYSLHEAKLPIIMNATGKMLNKEDDIRNLMYKQMFSPVQWIQTIQFMQNIGVHQFYEISVRPVLGKFVNCIIKNHVNVATII
jgi:[acyl-carrier-protein] S-malonyltransferase